MFTSQKDLHEALLPALREIEEDGTAASILRSGLRDPSDEEVARYRLVLSHRFKEGNRKEFGEALYFDEQNALVLLALDPRSGTHVPIGCIGFAVNGPRPGLLFRPYHLRIEQIQGVRIESKGVAPDHARLLRRTFGILAWERVLVKMLIALARRQAERGMTRVTILRAMYNGYYCDHAESHKRRLEARYDGTAEACGFSVDERGREHVLAL